MYRRREDRWNRIFVLLIFVMLAVVAADRIIEKRDGFSFLQSSVVPSNILPDSTATVGLAEEEEYLFLPPTEIPVTPSPTMTQTVVPTATLSAIAIDAAQWNTPESNPEAFTRPTPLAGIGGVITKCDEPYKRYRYALYGLASSSYRSLTGSLNYLPTDLNPTELAYEDGLIQKALPETFLNSFSLPETWLSDRLFTILGVSSDLRSLVIDRFGDDRGIYWVNFEDSKPTLLMSLSTPIEEAVHYPESGWIMIEVVEENTLHNLYLIDLTTGQLSSLTPYQSDSARHGRISVDGSRLAYETDEGVWVINIDGSFASMAITGATLPEWSPKNDRLVALINGRVYFSDLDRSDPQLVHDVFGKVVTAESAQWQPGGKHLILWKKTISFCEWVSYEISSGREDVLFQFPKEQCQAMSPFQFSPDENWLIGSVPAGLSDGLEPFDVVCDLTGNKGCFALQLYRGTYFCHEAGWSSLAPDFEWTFNETNEGWHVVQQISQVRITEGQWSGVSVGDFPVIASPGALGIDADRYRYLEVVMKVSAGHHATVYFSTIVQPQIDDTKSFQFPLQADGEFRRYVIDLWEVRNWTGVVNRIRIRPGDVENARIVIDSVRVFTGN